jgi:hypothetical protein
MFEDISKVPARVDKSKVFAAADFCFSVKYNSLRDTFDTLEYIRDHYEFDDDWSIYLDE